MKYHLKANGRDIAVKAMVSTGQETEVSIDQQTYDLETERVSEHEIMMAINGTQVRAWVEQMDTGKRILLNGRHYLIQDNDMRPGAGKGKSKGSGGEEEMITPPMPAIVIQVPVTLGERVEKGDTIVVVSAMKMETSLVAPHSGIVQKINVAQGDKVMPGDILADIQKEFKEGQAQ